MTESIVRLYYASYAVRGCSNLSLVKASGRLREMRVGDCASMHGLRGRAHSKNCEKRETSSLHELRFETDVRTV